MITGRRAITPILLSPLVLGACATTRVYSSAELSEVGRACGVASGEVVQEPDEPRILFLYTIGPSKAQLACVRDWSRQHKLHLAYIEAVNWTSQ